MVSELDIWRTDRTYDRQVLRRRSKTDLEAVGNPTQQPWL